MIVKINSTDRITARSETINGIRVLALLEAVAANTALPVTAYNTQVDFDPAQIKIEVILMRKNVPHTVFSDNLAVLANWATKQKNAALWLRGIALQEPAANVVAIESRSVFIPFAGHINVGADDELSCNVTVNRGAFSGSLNAQACTLQVEFNNSIGIEWSLPKFQSYPIQAQRNQDTLTLGDNVMDIMLMSFSTDSKKPVFTAATLGSDRLDWQKNEQELILEHFAHHAESTYDGILPANSKNPFFYPQSRIIQCGKEIDRAKVQITMNSVNVLQNENFVCYSSFVQTEEQVNKALAMQNKHQNADLQKIK
jgi:hypothetical protein